MEKVKVLQINIGEKFGGVSSMIYNIYQNIDSNKFEFDFVAPSKTSFDLYRTDIENSGGKIIELKSSGHFLKRKIQFFNRFYNLLKKNEYDVVHCNSGSIFFNIQVALIAKICKVKKIVIHSHNAGNDSKFKIILGNSFKPLVPYVATDFFSCSKKASIFMFPKKIIQSPKHVIIKNGVDTEKFKFNNKIRKITRDKLNLNDELVILHIGRFTNQKNHQKVIDIFNEIKKINNKSILLLVGEGELESEVKKRVNDYMLTNSVFFLGLRKDIPDLMSASDVFLLPSYYEGLPVVGVESQANGLKCCFSDVITKEINLFNNNKFISLDTPPKYWAERIIEMTAKNNLENREEYAVEVAKKGYSLKSVGEIVQKLYLE